MVDNLKLIVGTVAAAAAFGLGYGWGAHKVKDLEAQIESIKKTGAEVDAKLKQSQEEMARTLKEKEAEFARQSQQLKAEADRKEKDLTAALASTGGRIESLRAQLSAAQAKQAQLGAGTDAGTAAERKALQDQIDALRAGMDANQCLALAVPEPVIGPLVRRN